MPIRRWNALSVKSDTGAARLLSILVAALGFQSLGCASANVNQEPPGPDSGTADSAPGAGGKDSSSPKNDGPATDVLYGPCDPFTNSGCPSDQKCTTLRNGSALVIGCGSKGGKSEGDTCVPVPDTGSQTGDDCGNVLACFSITGQGQVCRRLCATSGTDTCPGTETCSLSVGSLSGLKFCQAALTCLPLEQTGCPDGQACYFGQKGAVCAPTGNKQPGDTCAGANDCAKNSTCLIVGSTGICSSFCSTASGGTPSCSGSSTGGTICSALPGGDAVEANLGSCRVQP
jgi:hypothetical protein